MLIRFWTENCLSLRDEQELSFVASSLGKQGGKTVAMPGGNTDLLCAAAIYGGNASGKTNVINAFSLMRSTILNSHSRWKGREGIADRSFYFDTVSRKKPTRFELDLLLDGVRYVYGFSMDRRIVLEETLYAYPRGKRQLWLERNAKSASQFKFGKKLGGENRTIEKLTRPNSLFLSAAAQNNHPQLSPIYEWFLNQITIYSDTTRTQLDTISSIENKELSANEILRFMQLADLGVSGIQLSDIDEDVSENMKKLKAGVLDLFKSHVREEIAEEFSSMIPSKKINLLHSGYSGRKISLDFGLESHGTQTLFSLIGPLLKTAKSGGVIVIDELENGMHPLLARQLVRIFNSSKSNSKNAQLIFTTHSTNLLREGLLRRDQVWLTEKDKKGATRLYPLSDFKPRKTENIENGYLQGRYGAVPYLGEIDTLFQKE